MGNAYLYYYPNDQSGVEKVDLGDGLSTLDDQSMPTGRLVRGIGGQVFPSTLGRYGVLRATLGGIIDTDVYAALRTFEAHAEQARPFGLVSDSAKVWAGYCNRVLTRGATSVPTGGNRFTAFASGTLASGDYVVLSTGYPESRWEMAKVSSVSSNTITLASGLVQTFRQSPVLVRYYRFFPLLYRRDHGPVVTDRVAGRVWQMDLTAETGALENPRADLLLGALESGTAADKVGGKTTLYDLGRNQTKDDGLGLPGGYEP